MTQTQSGSEEVTPELTPEPTPELAPELAQEPTPELTPEPTPELAPELVQEPTPELAPEPAPEPAPELAPEPAPVAVVAVRDAMEQVRDLLFGETKRTTDEHLRAIDDKIEALRADVLARLGKLENRLVDLSLETEQTQAASVDAIGSAIAQLGATVQNMSLIRKGG